jgi:hypothetical protein
MFALPPKADISCAPWHVRFAEARQRGSESRFQMIDDTDLAGTIPYLRKG